MEHNLRSWRLIQSQPACGSWNMALDEAVLESAIRGECLPTIRLYAWDPACLSLGIAQPVADVDVECLRSFGWDLVRRPTGGRAILHTDELTYAVIGTSQEPLLTGGVLESYQRISRGLLAALQILGLPAESQGDPIHGRNSESGPVCFQVPSNYEITVGGKKLVGSAQARRQNGVLQHGSLPMGGDLTRITKVLNYIDYEAQLADSRRLLERATTMETVTNRVYTWEETARAFQEAFSRVFTLQLQESEPTSWELTRAEELVRTKYGTPAWTHRV